MPCPYGQPASVGRYSTTALQCAAPLRGTHQAQDDATPRCARGAVPYISWNCLICSGVMVLTSVMRARSRIAMGSMLRASSALLASSIA